MENIKTRQSKLALFLKALLGTEQDGLTADERKELEAIEKANNNNNIEKTAIAFRDKYKKNAKDIGKGKTGIKTQDIKTRE